jgi:hypothetical protein
MNKFIAIALLAFSTVAQAAEPKVASAYHQIERNVKIVITNQPCEKFKAEVPLGAAYAINTDTGDTVTGCYALQNRVVYIELSDDENKNHYTYKYDVEVFQPTETM